MKIASFLCLALSSVVFTADAFAPASTLRAARSSSRVNQNTPAPCRAPAAGFRRGRSHLFMGWGPDPIWTDCDVLSNVQACPSGLCTSVKVAVPDGSEFLVPGQYVQMKQAGVEDAKPLFLAIASPPSGTAAKKEEADAAAGAPSEPAEWEFLIKKTDNNGWLTSAGAGVAVSVSQVMGGGFPMAENLEGFKYDFPTQNLMLFANGSGIAPIRSAIESGMLNVSKGRTCTLYYGVQTADDMPYVERFPAWEEIGVQVVPVVSRPDEPCATGTVWKGRTGYVQNALEEDGVSIPRNSGALLCGVKGMAESVKDMLTTAGVFEGRILTNF